MLFILRITAPSALEFSFKIVALAHHGKTPFNTPRMEPYYFLSMVQVTSLGPAHISAVLS